MCARNPVADDGIEPGEAVECVNPNGAEDAEHRLQDGALKS
jgi:hypothetical protein